MADKKKPTIFLSYSWKNTDVADEIDNTFKSIGLTFTRDVRDAPYRARIKEFMKRIGKTNYALLLVSDAFLRSENCMYEVTELLTVKNAHKRLLPIVLDDANTIFKAQGRTLYYDYWKAKEQEAEGLKKEHPTHDLIENAKLCHNIYHHLDGFFTLVTDFNTSTYRQLKADNYRPILTVIGFEEETLVEEVLAINKIQDAEEQELALEAFLQKHPDNLYGLFQKAYLANERKQYKKARQYYQDHLAKHPGDADAHYNVAILLEDYFDDYAGAKQHYETALQINPNDAKAHYNVAILLENHFADYEGAKQHYKTALQINPNYAKAHYNIAILLEDHFADHAGAKQHYEAALQINPNDGEAHDNLGILLADHFEDYEGAKLHHETALQINPNHANAHYNLARLLQTHFTDYAGAKQHYETALQINPNHANAHDNYANLLVEHFADYAGAKLHYETALQINPNHANAHYNVAILLEDHFTDYAGAKQHYETALQINPNYAYAHNNLAILLKQHFNDDAGAKQHYHTAVILKPSLKTKARDEFFGVR